MAFYFTIKNCAEAEIEEKKSRFIACIAPVETEEEARAFIEERRSAHRGAKHHVYAYVIWQGGIGGIERVRYSDDGEPQKTAGVPTLEAIRHAGLINVVAVVTRYFGGTLLGTGGLVRAYTQAVQAAIEKAEVVVVSQCIEATVEVPYTIYEKAQREAESLGAKVTDSSFKDRVVFEMLVPADKEAALTERMSELSRGRATVTIGESSDAAL